MLGCRHAELRDKSSIVANKYKEKFPAGTTKKKKTLKAWMDGRRYQRQKLSSCSDKEMKTEFVHSHIVCLRFYIQMSLSRTPWRLSLCPES